MKRRGFFRSLAKAAAIVALAPQIAFRVKADPIGTVDGLFVSNRAWTQEEVQKDFVRSFFYGKPIPGAALEGWKELEPIQTYAHPFAVWLSKKAHEEEALS